MFCVMRHFNRPAASRRGKHLVRRVRLRLAEVVVEDLPDHGPGFVRVRKEVVQLQHPRDRTCSRGRPGRGRAGCRSQRRCPRQ